MFVMAGRQNVKAEGTEPVKVDAEHFPDELFRATMSGFDTDKDGSLSEQEISVITDLNYDGGDYSVCKELGSLKGIEYLTSLESIHLGYNKVAELDFSRNTKLKVITIYNMPLQNINLKNNAELERFEASNIPLTSLDLSGNEKLKIFRCRFADGLEYIEFGNKPLLKTISCADSGLKKLTLKNMPQLEKLNVANAKLSKLDVSGLKNLRILYCSGKKLKKLTLCDNKNLKVGLTTSDKLKISWKNAKKNETFKCSKKNIVKADKKGNISALKAGKTKLSCGKNKCVIKIQKSH